ncbi:MAG: hypothetical protein L6R39_001033 [Caloplaca ligustica]|nr:MAG: hypothetical protein L6R39_001033 [Caloplaca ligustica]
MRPPPVPSPDGKPRRSSRVLPPSQSSLSSRDTFVQPQSSDHSSQGQKRKRAASDIVSSSVRVSQATSFPTNIKKQIRKESSGERCRYCGDEGLDVAQLLASAERHTYEHLTAMGLITLQHLHEKQKKRTDLQRRREVWDTDRTVLYHKPPTAIAYMENQRQRHSLLPGARWGSYECYTLREFGPLGKEFRKGYTVTKWWHGDPMAALDRAFRGLLYHSADLPPRLEILHRLYQDNDVHIARLNTPAPAHPQDDENGSSSSS